MTWRPLFPWLLLCVFRNREGEIRLSARLLAEVKSFYEQVAAELQLGRFAASPAGSSNLGA